VLITRASITGPGLCNAVCGAPGCRRGLERAVGKAKEGGSAAAFFFFWHWGVAVLRNGGPSAPPSVALPTIINPGDEAMSSDSSCACLRAGLAGQTPCVAGVKKKRGGGGSGGAMGRGKALRSPRSLLGLTLFFHTASCFSSKPGSMRSGTATKIRRTRR
jgi:hypothetical protein